MHKNNDNFIEYNIIISFLNKKRYRKRKKLRYIVHLILYMDIKILNVHLEFNSTCALYCINYIFNTALISFLCYNFNKLNLTYIISISFIVNLIIWIIIGILKKRVYSII